MTRYKQNKPSLSTFITIFTLFCTASGLYASNQVSQAKADERISSLKFQIEDVRSGFKEISDIKTQIAEIRADQRNQKALLERMVNYIERGNNGR